MRQLARVVLAAGPLVAAAAMAAPYVLPGAPEPAEAAAGASGAAPELAAAEFPQVVPGPFLALEHATGSRYGIDVSWPQCEQVLPDLPIDFAVIGLTDGQAESVNPCLAEQVAWARSVKARVGFYVVPEQPERGHPQPRSRPRRVRGPPMSSAGTSRPVFSRRRARARRR